jgi:hypothetical protein
MWSVLRCVSYILPSEVGPALPEDAFTADCRKKARCQTEMDRKGDMWSNSKTEVTDLCLFRNVALDCPENIRQIGCWVGFVGR